ncbi:GIY-YIG catalytic domain-containing endonuclease [Acanthocystis turfacea Chlorella virus GM0701.1]|nr:GIY-YIG catalytic domain-containing endonuclease [Acanthocystis turfacea Chlorella virus GM0701.1]
MIIAKKRSDIGKLYFVLDNVMFWEAFRWERLDIGHIYIQKFSNGKMYAGLTVNLIRRMSDYKRLKGNNDHHTKALKKHSDTMQISFTKCPNYLMDAVEIFVIDFYDLTDPSKGYNKTTGGRKSFRHTKETRMKMSVALSGANHPLYGKHHTKESRIKMSISKTGEKNYWFGKTHTEETRVKMTGKTRTCETRKQMSNSKKGFKHPKAKPVCVFGKLYGSASTASDVLRTSCGTTSKGNFIKDWVLSKKHQHNIFYVSKEFYSTMKDTSEVITLDMYMLWIE